MDWPGSTGDTIEGVKCPICRERLTGNTADELNMNLKNHMSDLHQMRRLEPSQQGGAYQSRSDTPQAWTERETRTSTYGGPVERREMTSREAGSGSWGMSRGGEEGGMGEMRDVRHGGGWAHRTWHRYDDMTMSMRCPLCDNNIYGSDQEDLSDEIRFHFKDAHRDVLDR